jgi:hypothetical protein
MTARKKQAPTILGTLQFAMKVDFTKEMMESMLEDIFQSLLWIRSNDRRAVVTSKHPLVVALKTLDGEFSIEGDLVTERIQPTEEELASLLQFLPTDASPEFLSYLEDWQQYESEEFNWSAIPQDRRKPLVDHVSATFLPRIQAVLAQEQADAKKRDEEEAERKRRQLQQPIDAAIATLQRAGYTITPPAPKAAKKAAPCKR